MLEIIAEVGECFNGSMKRAKQMIEEAAVAGCDTVKFQILDMHEVAADDPEYEWFQKIELDREKVHILKGWAESAKISILFTPVSVRTAEYIYAEGMDTVKIASSFVRKQEMLDYINCHFQKVYMSTGMAELDEVHRALASLNRVKKIVLLHCISEYPTGPLLEQRGLRALDEQDAHLNMIKLLKEEFPNIEVGYSDHTDGIFVPVLAVAAGAEVIEKHFTLDRQTPMDHYNAKREYMGTDHVLSVEPPELREMVRQIRRTEACMGEMSWHRSEGELVLRNFLRGRYTERD